MRSLYQPLHHHLHLHQLLLLLLRMMMNTWLCHWNCDSHFAKRVALYLVRLWALLRLIVPLASWSLPRLKHCND